PVSVPARVTIRQPRDLPPREPCPPAGPRADRDAGDLRLLPVRAVPVRPGTPRAGRRDLSRRPALGVTLLSAAACSLLVVGALGLLAHARLRGVLRGAQRDLGHRGVVALAGADLGDAGVAAGTLREGRGDLLEQRVDDALVTDGLHDAATRGQIALLRLGD